MVYLGSLLHQTVNLGLKVAPGKHSPYVYFETGTLRWVHGDAFNVSIAAAIFYGVGHWGRGVLHQVYLA